MRRSRRKVLRLTGAALLLVAGLGGAAAAGWLPPVNRWVERRLLAELHSAGLETDATHLRELSWRRAAVGPVEMHLPGLVLRAEEARAELGWNVLVRRGEPHVVVHGVVLEAEVDRLGELRGMLQSQSGALPNGRLDIEQARVVLRHGERRLELPCSGYLETSDGSFRVSVAAEAPELSGRVTARRNGAAGVIVLGVHDGRLKPEPWRLLLDGVVPAAVTAARFVPEAQARISGTATLAGGSPAAAKVEAVLPAFEWSDGTNSASVGEGRLVLGVESADAWRCEVSTECAAWAAGERSVRLDHATLVLEPRNARLSFADGRAAVAGFSLAGGGEAAARRQDTNSPWTADALVRLGAAEARGYTLASPAEIRARWNGAEVGLSAEALQLQGSCALRLEALEATVGGWTEGSPRLVAQAQVAADAGGWLAANGSAWQLQPAGVSAKVTVSATLEAGREGARAEIALPAQRRTLVWPEGRAEAVVGGEAVVTLDRAHISGRTALEVHEVIVRQRGWSLMAPEATFALRWPRVWLGALDQWGRAPMERLLRELLWVGDYDGKLSDGVLRYGPSWCATGVGLQLHSRGAELHETGGLAFGATAAELADGTGLRATDLMLEANAGLEGGELRAGCAVPDLAIRPTCEQTLRWVSGLEADGSFGFDPVVLSGKEPLARWFPQLAGWELSGGVGLNGRSRLERGEWTFGGDVLLSDFAVRNEAQKVSLDGIRGRVVLESLYPLCTAPGQELTYESAALGPVELTGGSVGFAFAAPGRLSVERWTSGGFGGRLECTPFACDLLDPELETRLSLKGVQAGQLLKLFKDVPAEAEATVDGSVPLRFSAGRAGFGTGWVRLAPGELGKVRFTRDLHLLTEGRRPGGPGYAALRQVEQAIQVLLFDRLQIDTYPKGQDGQPMRIRLIGTPAGREFAVPVTIDVNVNAPLEHFLNWGLGNRAKTARPAAP